MINRSKHGRREISEPLKREEDEEEYLEYIFLIHCYLLVPENFNSASAAVMGAKERQTLQTSD